MKALGKFQCCQTLMTRSKKQTSPPETAANAGGARSFVAATITVAPARAAVA